MVRVPFQPGGEAHTLAAIGWGDEPGDLNQLVIPQPLNRTQLFERLEPLVEWFTPRFEAAWEQAVFDDDVGAYTAELDLLPQVITANSASTAALGRLGRRLAYLPTEPSDDPNDPPPASVELVRFGSVLRWLASNSTAPGQNMILDLVSMNQFHWITVQSLGERAHLGAIDAWIGPPDGVDPDAAADAAERLSIGPYAVPSHEHPITDTIAALGEAERAGEPTAELEDDLGILWAGLIRPVWDRCWRSIDRLRTLDPDERYLPIRRQHDADSYVRQMAWLDGPNGGRTRTRDTPRQAIWAKKMAEYEHGVLEAEEIVTDPLAMVDEILVGKAISGRVASVDLTHKEVRTGNQRATLAPIVTLECDRACLVPLGRLLWWVEDCKRVQVELLVAEQLTDGRSVVELKVTKNMKEGGERLEAIATVGGSATFSVYSTDVFFPSKLPPDDPFTHTHPTQAPDHIEDPGDPA